MFLFAAALVTFPGSATQVSSPDRRYTVINVNRDQPPNHILWLKELRTGSKTELMRYKRHVDVSWSPNSQLLFINDYAESNEADCIVLDPETMKKRSMTAALRIQLRQWHAANAGHLYVKCSFWRRANLLDVSVTAYGPGSIQKHVLVDARTGRALLRR